MHRQAGEDALQQFAFACPRRPGDQPVRSVPAEGESDDLAGVRHPDGHLQRLGAAGPVPEALDGQRRWRSGARQIQETGMSVAGAGRSRLAERGQAPGEHLGIVRRQGVGGEADGALLRPRAREPGLTLRHDDCRRGSGRKVTAVLGEDDGVHPAPGAPRMAATSASAEGRWATSASMTTRSRLPSLRSRTLRAREPASVSAPLASQATSAPGPSRTWGSHRVHAQDGEPATAAMARSAGACSAAAWRRRDLTRLCPRPATPVTAESPGRVIGAASSHAWPARVAARSAARGPLRAGAAVESSIEGRLPSRGAGPGSRHPRAGAPRAAPPAPESRDGASRHRDGTRPARGPALPGPQPTLGRGRRAFPGTGGAGSAGGTDPP